MNPLVASCPLVLYHSLQTTWNRYLIMKKTPRFSALVRDGELSTSPPQRPPRRTWASTQNNTLLFYRMLFSVLSYPRLYLLSY